MQECHPGKYAATVVEKNTGLAGVFIRGPGFCNSKKKFFSFSQKPGSRINTPARPVFFSTTVAAYFPG
jgi:hypothetical protein